MASVRARSLQKWPRFRAGLRALIILDLARRRAENSGTKAREKEREVFPNRKIHFGLPPEKGRVRATIFVASLLPGYFSINVPQMNQRAR